MMIPVTFFFTGIVITISKKFLVIVENLFLIIVYILLTSLFFSINFIGLSNPALWPKLIFAYDKLYFSFSYFERIIFPYL